MSSAIYRMLVEDIRMINSFVEDSYRQVVEGRSGGYYNFQETLRKKMEGFSRLCMVLLEENAEIMSNMEQAHRVLRDAVCHNFMVRRDGGVIQPMDVMVLGEEKIKIDMMHNQVIALMEEGFTSFREYLKERDLKIKKG